VRDGDGLEARHVRGKKRHQGRDFTNLESGGGVTPKINPSKMEKKSYMKPTGRGGGWGKHEGTFSRRGLFTSRPWPWGEEEGGIPHVKP